MLKLDNACLPEKARESGCNKVINVCFSLLPLLLWVSVVISTYHNVLEVGDNAIIPSYPWIPDFCLAIEICFQSVNFSWELNIFYYKMPDDGFVCYDIYILIRIKFLIFCGPTTCLMFADHRWGNADLCTFQLLVEYV